MDFGAFGGMGAGKLLFAGVSRVKFSIALSALMAGAYVALSAGGFFIPLDALYAFAFNLSRPWNFISYAFIHTGYHHLLENLVSLFAFAVVAELALGADEASNVFFFSAIASAVVFSLASPAFVLIGASAGISGLLGAAFMLNTKRAVLAVATVFAVTYLVVLPVVDYSFGVYAEGLEKQSAELKKGVDAALAAGDAERAGQLGSRLGSVETQRSTEYKGLEFEAEAVVDPWIHGYGALFGIGYLWFRKRNLMLRNVEALNRGFSALARKLH